MVRVDLRQFEPSIRIDSQIKQDSFATQAVETQHLNNLPHLLQEPLDPIQPLINLLHPRRKTQPHVRFKSAVIPRHHRDMALFQQSGGEADGIGDFDPLGGFSKVGADIWEAIKRTLWPNAVHVWQSG